ncbi:hypothetical protein [Micromonospora wenchangensis]|uniref:hypothetical protein n=1 Tax=Micromonospora wenchangensis TaxID=1185415 RepID=UPI00381689EC
MTSRAPGRNTVPIWSTRSWSGVWMRDSMAEAPSNIPGPIGMFMAVSVTEMYAVGDAQFPHAGPGGVDLAVAAPVLLAG